MSLDKQFLNTPLAHRGLHAINSGVPENSIAAFRAAIARGYGIECDLQISSDGQAMVFHDEELDRLTDETGRVDKQNARDLGHIALIGGNAGIPTLAELLDEVAGRVPLLIEIKDQDGALGPNTGALEAEAARLLLDYSGPVAVQSFNPNAIEMFHAHAPTVETGLVTCDFTDESWDYVPKSRRIQLTAMRDLERANASFISHDHSDLKSAHVAAVKARGLNVLCWTVCSKADEKKARKVADNITFEGYSA